MLEKELRRFLGNNWTGFIDWLEPRGNAGIGRPDCDLLISGIISCVELKIGSIMTNNIFLIRKMRSEQISWQHRFHYHGGMSFFLVADSLDDIFFCRKIIKADHPFYRFDLFKKIDPKNFEKEIRCTVNEWRDD